MAAYVQTYDKGGGGMTARNVLDFWTHKTWDSSMKYVYFEVSYVRMSHQFKVTKLYVMLKYSRINYICFSCVNQTDFVLLPHSVSTGVLISP